VSEFFFFFVLLLPVALSCFVLGIRVAIKQNNKEVTPSASHNKASPSASQIADDIESEVNKVKNSTYPLNLCHVEKWCWQLRALQ